MFKVNINGEIINKNCEFFTIINGSNINVSDDWIYLFPNNDNFLRFWKYRKKIILLKFNTSVKENIRFNNREEFEIYKEKSFSFIEEHEMIFEFPDEETAFYFKLKYC